MRIPVLLASLLAVGALSPVPALADGVVRFSGRIVEAPCRVKASLDMRGFELGDCPATAAGSRLSIRPMDASAAAMLADTFSGTRSVAVPVSGTPVGIKDPGFSGHYRIEAGHSGAYQVRIDYL